ncbi:TPA: helix-turn-helix transcriptional regulator [Staphylococcus pseudintermedius]|nr:helix-turn-helix transcriptional regulator [Staphylococcus pseudintermedius]EIW3382332.1 helix-turn-helix transcriptional regulator [Staphylococcus pseudintermedius]EJD8532576.1 helix-turn-helix transcriptional regulator [Staphylococcus pseudintermedius]HAR5820010.1 helix-turn-helix transcriptional regulator [Staphylococcus pseudintermedius]
MSEKKLGNLIRYIRNSKNLDQKSFAKEISTTVSALSNWENGRNYPKPQYINNICKKFDIPKSYLTMTTEERIKEIVEDLETQTNYKPIYKNLYDLQFKFSLIKDITTLVDSRFSSLGFYTDKDLRELIDDYIHTRDITIKYEPFNNINSIRFADDRVYNCRYEIKKILNDKNIDKKLIDEIDNFIGEAQIKIQDIEKNYKED